MADTGFRMGLQFKAFLIILCIPHNIRIARCKFFISFRFSSQTLVRIRRPFG